MTINALGVNKEKFKKMSEENLDSEIDLVAKEYNWLAMKLEVPELDMVNPTMGRPKKIQQPELLWNYACDYFNHVDTYPFLKQDFIRGGNNAGKSVNVKHVRPYTWDGLEVYLFSRGILSNLTHYVQNRRGGYDNFVAIIRAIDKVIRDRNFTGAAVGAFSPNLIARQLGLAEKTITEDQTSETVDYAKLSDDALEEIHEARVIEIGKTIEIGESNE